LGEGDLDAVKSTLAKLPVDSKSNEIKRNFSYVLAMYHRDFVEARNVLAGAPPFRDVFLVPVPLRFFEGVIARAQHDDAAASAAFADARREVIGRWGDDQTNPGEQGLLGAIDAALGQKEEAIRRGRHALELRPIAKESWEGAVLALNLVDIYACTGERELALQQLEQLAKLPGAVTYSHLKYSFFCLCFWDDLRADPRYQAILASLDPARPTRR
jgi:tetratricopeptide (TPR) repeat protein